MRPFPLLLMLSACGTTAVDQLIVPGSDPATRGTCPAVSSASLAEQVSQLSRQVREARADLMTRARLGRPHAPVFVTLYPQQLVLASEALVAPKAAQQRDRGWLKSRLLRAEVELRSGEALALDGDLEGVSLAHEDGGAGYRPLYSWRRREGDGFVYRLVFAAPDRFAAGRITLTVPVHGGLQASWGLSARYLAAIERWPLADALAVDRDLRRIRRALLLGDLTRARALIAGVEGCVPRAAAALAAVADRLADPPAGAAAVAESAVAPVEAPSVEMQVALRGGLLSRLRPAAQAGLLPVAAFRRADDALRRAARAAPPKAGGALFAFEQALAEMLRHGLDSRETVEAAGELPPPLEARVSRGAVEALLRDRVDRATLALVPRLVGPAKGDAAGQPLLSGEDDGVEVLARVDQRLAGGWFHPGLPELDYRLRFVDRSAVFWARRAVELKDRAAITARARELVRGAIQGAVPIATLALAGWLRLEPAKAGPVVRRALDAGRPSRRVAALGAVAATGGRQWVPLVRSLAASREVTVRAAAMAAAGTLGLDEIVAQGLTADEAVQIAAMRAGLRRGAAGALRLARDWLGGAAPRRDRVLAAAAADGRVARQLKRELLQQLEREAPPEAAVRAAARLGPVAVAALARLYGRAPTLRAAILESCVRGCDTLLRRGAREQDPGLRRRAVQGLARQGRSARRELQRAIDDPDSGVRLAGHVGLARIKRSASLLALGGGARGSCTERGIVLESMMRLLEPASRRRLLLDALQSDCSALHAEAWRLVVKHQPDDPALLRAGLGHPDARLRLQAALTALGLRDGPALGRLP